MKPLFHYLLVATALALPADDAQAQLPGTRPIDLVNMPVTKGAMRIAYGPVALQFGELRVPEGKGPHPVVIMVHGGCWSNRLHDLDPREVALDYFRPAAATLAQAGFAVWNIEYRRLGDTGGGWPNTILDVARAADALRNFATVHDLDLDRVISMGHSSGGHLALWLAARPRIPAQSALYMTNPLPLKASLVLDGPPDLRRVLPLQQRICARSVMQELLGGTPEEYPDRYHAASPAELLPLAVPQHLLAGPFTALEATKYEAAARAAGNDPKITLLPEAGHHDFADPQSATWPVVIDAVRALFAPGRIR